MGDDRQDEKLQTQIARLQARVEEAEEALRAIRQGEVDAVIVTTKQGKRVFTLESADLPYRLLVEQMQQGAVTVSDDGVILYSNAFFAELLGQQVNVLVSRPIDQYLSTDSRADFQSFLKAIPSASNSSLSQEFSLLCCNGDQTIPVYVTGNYLNLDQMKVICLIFTDLRERKKAEEQALAYAIEKQKTQLLANFVRNTSHDLRTPLSTILVGLGNISYILDETRRKEKIKQVEQYVLSLSNVLEQFQYMATLDYVSELKLRTGSINEIIIDAVGYSSHSASDRNIKIVTELITDPKDVHFEQDSLYRAIGELLKNAIIFSHQDSKIVVRTSLDNMRGFVIAVIDYGDGISPDILPHIFERLFKGDSSRKMSGGAGLGLSIVKRVVDLHQGWVEVESIPSQQTTVRIILPTVRSS